MACDNAQIEIDSTQNKINFTREKTIIRIWDNDATIISSVIQ